MFSCEYSKSFRNSLFYRTVPVAVFNYVLVSETIFKKESREIDFDLITLFKVQIQEPTSRSTSTRAFVFLAKVAEFYYHKIFEVKI